MQIKGGAPRRLEHDRPGRIDWRVQLRPGRGFLVVWREGSGHVSECETGIGRHRSRAVPTNPLRHTISARERPSTRFAGRCAPSG